MSRESYVVLFVSDARRRERWMRAIARTGIRVLTGEELDAAGKCEVVVTDHLERNDWPGALLVAQARGDVGVIQVGGTCGGDVVLPAECTDRELCLSCRLLVEIVRLRRKLRQRRGTQRALQRMAFEDSLTGLPNRRAWEREVATGLATSLDNASLAVAVLDVDRFKLLNDEHGHPVADQALIAAAHCLRTSVRAGDVVARLGGDEFGLLLTDIEPDIAMAVIQRVCQAAGREATKAAGVPVTLSAGLTVGRGSRITALMEAADEALRQAKQAGRNTVIFSPADDPALPDSQSAS